MQEKLNGSASNGKHKEQCCDNCIFYKLSEDLRYFCVNVHQSRKLYPEDTHYCFYHVSDSYEKR